MKVRQKKNGNVRITLSPDDARQLAALLGETTGGALGGLYDDLTTELGIDLSRRTVDQYGGRWTHVKVGMKWTPGVTP